MPKRFWMRPAAILLTVYAALWAAQGGNASETGLMAGLHRMSESKVDVTRRDEASRAANDLLASWREGRFESLPDVFSLEMIRGLPPEDQQKAQANLKFLFGDFKGLEYVEAYASTGLPGMVVYRFKGTFSAATATPEIRVSVGPNGLINGFWVRHWKDEPE